MHSLATLDHRYLWHPFTQMRDWLQREPIVIVSGKGSVLRDVHGKEYLDANASIWTNLHGHSHPKINAAIRKQLQKVAHSSALGLANEPASLLGEALVQATHLDLPKVFFSDDGSTALEVALKLAYECARRTGRSRTPRFLSLEGAYHGDTVGAVSLGHIDLFHKAYAGLLFASDQVMAPYCYRCPFNRAKPARADARQTRQCHSECLGKVEQCLARQKKKGQPYAAMVVEPVLQGAAGMIPQPAGWLRAVATLLRDHGAQLIADEVMTGFGRLGTAALQHRTSMGHSTGLEEDALSLRERVRVRGKQTAFDPKGDDSFSAKPEARSLLPPLFACDREGVRPDFLAVAKGLTGGYLPMAATLTTQEVFDAFLGDYADFKTFFHGHSFTANQLGSAAALASLELLQAQRSLRARQGLEQVLRAELPSLWALPNVGDIRQEGLVAGIELVKDWRTRQPFDLRDQAGLRVCAEMARRGVLTRPIGNVIPLLPPYCTSPDQAVQIVAVLKQAVQAVLGSRKQPQ